MLFFFKGRSVIVGRSLKARLEADPAVVPPMHTNARAVLRIENADTSGAIRRDRQTIEDNSLL